MHRQRLTFLALALLLLAGCGHAPVGIVGKWKGTWSNPSLPGVVYKISTEYKPDGTAVSEEDTPFGPASGTLTYRSTDKTLTQQAVTVKMNGKDVPNSGNTPSPDEVYTFKIEGDTLTMDRQDVPTHVVLKRTN